MLPETEHSTFETRFSDLRAKAEAGEEIPAEAYAEILAELARVRGWTKPAVVAKPAKKKPTPILDLSIFE